MKALTIPEIAQALWEVSSVLILKIDEMTAEAGFDTRLEAFCEVVLQERNGYE